MMFRWIFGFFLSYWGIFVLATLDSSVAFYLPFATDAAVLMVTARKQDWFWLCPLIATGGSLVGAAVTYAVGKNLGDKDLEKFLSARHLNQVKDKVKNKGAVALALPAIIPPPFPFTAFVLTSGALEVSRKGFFPTLALMRLLRYGGESLLALHYGGRIIRWMNSTAFQAAIWSFFVLILASIGYSVYRLVFRKSY